MRFINKIVFLLFLSGATLTVYAEEMKMSGDALKEIIKSIAEEHDENANVLHFSLKGVAMICIYDEAHNRMRIISPIIEADKLTTDQKDRILESNFHAALDGRYCTSNGVLYSAFIHPLTSLSETDILSAVYQVLSLNKSFGTSYYSGLMTFGGEDEKGTSL